MLILIGLSVLIVGLTHWITSPYGYWKKKGVAGPKPKLFVGNMGHSVTFSKNPGQWYKEIYDEYKNYAYVGYYKFRRPGIILRDIELVKDVLVKQFSSFHDNDLEVDENVDPLFGKNPFCLRGDKWKTIRSLITSAITPSKVRNMFNLINHVGENMIKYLKSEPKSSLTCMNVKDLAEKFTTDAVASCGFGFEGKSFEDPNAEFKKLGELFSTPTIWMGVKQFITFIFPVLGKIFKIRLLPSQLENYFTGILKNNIEYRQKNNIVRNDYLDLILSLKSKPNKYGFDDVDVMAQAMTFYIDGYETSSVAISFALYEIASNPLVQQQLRQEIQTTLDKCNGEITYDIVQDMTYLDQVVSESLRMHSPLSFMVRLCTKSYELPPQKEGGTTVKLDVGSPIVIPVLAIHNEPAFYPNPEKFDPERFNEENKNSRPKYAFLPFGEGPRVCLGFKFGLAQTKCVITQILTHFKISVNKKTKEPLQMDPMYFITAPIGGLWLDFEKL